MVSLILFLGHLTTAHAFGWHWIDVWTDSIMLLHYPDLSWKFQKYGMKHNGNACPQEHLPSNNCASQISIFQHSKASMTPATYSCPRTPFKFFWKQGVSCVHQMAVWVDYTWQNLSLNIFILPKLPSMENGYRRTFSLSSSQGFWIKISQQIEHLQLGKVFQIKSKNTTMVYM